MAGTGTLDLNGIFKERYAPKLLDLVPKESLLTKAIGFSKQGLLGDLYHQPVVLQNEQGFTYAAPNSNFFNINAPYSMVTQDAQVNGYSILENSGVSYEAAARGANGDQASFENVMDLVMENAMTSFGLRLEVSLLYGQSPTGLGKTTATSTNVSSTSTKFAFATGQWSAGLWTPLQGADLDIFNASGTAINTVGAIKVASVDIPNKTLTVTAAAADITAIDAYLDGTSGHYGVLRFYAAGNATPQEAIGLDAIMLNTGTMFNINAGTYNLWQANTFNVAGALTLAKIQEGLETAAARGLDKDVTLYVNTSKWRQLSSEQVAYRQLDSSYSSKKVQNGFEAIEFYTQTGKVTVMAHKYVKEGEAFALPTEDALRVGATDVTFNIPGTNNGQVFIQSQTQAGYTFRIYSNQALLVTRPANCVKFYGIV